VARVTVVPRSAIYVGNVRHRRHRPRPNAFRYGVYWALIDVDELPELDRTVRGFGYRRPAPIGFRDTDHLGDADVPVRLKLARWLAERGVELPPGRVEVLANLRVLGHVFDPVSWWFCRDADDRVALVVAEVHNTFGEAHAYLLDRLDHRPDGTIRATAPKVFHVSPFLPTDGHTYTFTFTPPGERLMVHIDVDDEDGRVLDATQTAVRRPFVTDELRSAVVRHPLVTLRTVWLIHRQAVRLLRHRTPFHPKPAAPDDGFGALDRATRAKVEAIPGDADPEPVPVSTDRWHRQEMVP
jgi:uncharacterized protein